MITVLGKWEFGLHSDEFFVEWRFWKNACQAYAVDRWIMVGHPGPAPGDIVECFETMAEALATTIGLRIFLIPDAAQSLRSFSFPSDDFVLIFGNSNENLKAYVGNGDVALKIVTPAAVPMYAPAACGIVLHECR